VEPAARAVSASLAAASTADSSIVMKEFRSEYFRARCRSAAAYDSAVTSPSRIAAAAAATPSSASSFSDTAPVATDTVSFSMNNLSSFVGTRQRTDHRIIRWPADALALFHDDQKFGAERSVERLWIDAWRLGPVPNGRWPRL
jgi:hypothetical protein